MFRHRHHLPNDGSRYEIASGGSHGLCPGWRKEISVAPAARSLAAIFLTVVLIDGLDSVLGLELSGGGGGGGVHLLELRGGDLVRSAVGRE